MIQRIKYIIKNSYLYEIIKPLQLMIWKKSGRPIPPPHVVKQAAIKECANKYNIKILIESGTYFGDMVHAMRNHFSKIYSIELDNNLFEKARNRFSGINHINIIHGDSGKIIYDIISDIKEPCIFWLDGHYSGGVTAKGDIHTPILQELGFILNHPLKNHVILIDDAISFDGRNGYPTIKSLEKYLSQNSNAYFLKLKMILFGFTHP